MSNTREEALREFMTAFDQPTDQPITQDTIDILMLGRKLIQEEARELFQAIDDCHIDLMSGRFRRPLPDSMDNLLKELADLQYVVSWFAAAFGIPLEEVFQAVHASNMSKLSPCPKCYAMGTPDDGQCPTCGGRGMVVLKRSDGKVLKGPDYREPDMSRFVEGLQR